MRERPTMRALLDHLRSRGLLNDDGMAAIAKKLAPQEPPPPAFVRVLVVLGAWFSATFFTVFILATFFRNQQENSLAMGVGYLAGATLLHRVARHFFFHQVALALLVAGFILALVGVGEQTSGALERDAVTATAIALAAALYVLYPDDLQRFMMPLAAAGVAAITLMDHPSDGQLWRLDVYAGLELAATVLIFTNVRLRARFLPLGYAMAAGALLALATHAVWREEAILRWLFGTNIAPFFLLLRLLAVAAGIWLIRWAACDIRPEPGLNNAWWRSKTVWAAVCAILLLGVLVPPGVLIALLLMVLGRGSAERRLEALGAVAFAGFLVDLYYNVDVGFLEKSLVLIASGVTTLCAWWVFTRSLPGKGGDPCAPSTPASPLPQP